MNIFPLDYDFDKAAQQHVNRHVHKILTEACQILATCYPTGACRMVITHENTSLPKWVRSSLSNFNYAVAYGYALSKEYSYRYGKVHKCHSDLDWYSANIPKIPDIGLTRQPRAFGEWKSKLPETDCIVADYRRYYLAAKKPLFFQKYSHAWKNREIPSWIQNYLTTGEISVD